MADSTAIATFVAAMNGFFARQDKDIADIQTEMDQLNALIKTLQDSAGQITAADQATLDAIQAKASSLSDKLDSMDTIVPPPAPTPVVLGAPIPADIPPAPAP